MKKVSILSVLALSLGVFIFSSCSGDKAQMPKAQLNSELDSLAYAIGISNSHGLKERLLASGIDSTYIDAFIQGLLDASSVTDTQKIAYSMGFQYGQGFSDESFKQFNKSLFEDDSTKSLSKEQFMAGIIAGILEKDAKIDPMTSSDYANKVVEKIKSAQAEKLYGSNKAAGIDFLNKNKSKEGIQVLPSGLQYRIIKEGTGAKPTRTDRVKVNYKGTLVDGTEFESSYTRPEAPVFNVTQVIPGWTEALLMMPVGSKWELYIPQELAYGVQDRGTIKPFSTLIFEMELLDIEKPAPAPGQSQQPQVNPQSK